MFTFLLYLVDTWILETAFKKLRGNVSEQLVIQICLELTNNNFSYYESSDQ